METAAGDAAGASLEDEEDELMHYLVQVNTDEATSAHLLTDAAGREEEGEDDDDAASSGDEFQPSGDEFQPPSGGSANLLESQSSPVRRSGRQLASDSAEVEAAAGGSSAEGDAGKVTPRRKRIRQKCVDNLKKQGAAMKRRAVAKQGEIELGTVVRIAVADVDRARIDPSTLTLVVVEKVETGQVFKEMKYRLAGNKGYLKSLYTRNYLDPVKGVLHSLTYRTE
jgi:hypothetical protein